MAQIFLIGVSVVALGAISWGVLRLIDVMRSRARVAERLLLND